MTTDQTGPSRTRIIAARILVVLGVVLVVISLFANFVKREALDEETFRGTSQELIANDDIRDQVAATMVDQLYANVDVAARLQERLPEEPAAARGAARRALARGDRQGGPRAARATARPEPLRERVVARTGAGGQGARGRNHTARDHGRERRPRPPPAGRPAGRSLRVPRRRLRTLPPDAGRITILRSDQLDTAQSLTQALKIVANWIWIPALLAWAAALWLVPGRRRREVRAISIGLIVAGVAILIIRRVAGSYLVDNLTDFRVDSAGGGRVLDHPLRRARRGGMGFASWSA